MRQTLLFFLLTLVLGVPRAEALTVRKADPFLGAVVVDANSGERLFEQGGETMVYPASTLKLMDLLIILEQVERGGLRLDQDVVVDAEAAGMGGSQVYLAEGEVFTVEELLYALMVQSANDAAVALAKQVAGTKEGFVRLMNEKAKSLGMNHTRFHSVHGLPPGEGQSPDVSTAGDMAILARALLTHPEALIYTAVQERGFRDGKFILRTHNPLLRTFPGCDGLKTGYFRKGGYSIVATAVRDGRRLVAAVMGCESKKMRNAKAAELLSLGFLEAAGR